MKWLRRLFGPPADAPSRNAASPRDLRAWAEDWQVGDIAECIGDGWLDPQPYNPKMGDVLTVAAIAECVADAGPWQGALFIGLAFEGLPRGCFYNNTAFRKHRPAALIIGAAISAARRERQPA